MWGSEDREHKNHQIALAEGNLLPCTRPKLFRKVLQPFQIVYSMHTNIYGHIYALLCMDCWPCIYIENGKNPARARKEINSLIFFFFYFLYAAIAFSSSPTSFFFHFSFFFLYIYFSSRFSFLLTRAIKNRSRTHTQTQNEKESESNSQDLPKTPQPLPNFLPFFLSFLSLRASLYFILFHFFSAALLLWLSLLFFFHISGNILESECTAPPPVNPQYPPYPSTPRKLAIIPTEQKSIHVRKKERKRNPKVKMK